MDIDMHHGHEHASCTWTCRMDVDIDMKHEYGYATWKWMCGMSMDVQHGHGHTVACSMDNGHASWTCFLSFIFLFRIFHLNIQYINCILAHTVPVTNIVATIIDDIVKDDSGHVHTVHAACTWTCSMDVDMDIKQGMDMLHGHGHARLT